MTRITKIKKAEKEIRKQKQFEERRTRSAKIALEACLERYEKLWPKSRKRWTHIILTLIYYGLLVTVKLLIITVLIVIKYYIGIFN